MIDYIRDMAAVLSLAAIGYGAWQFHPGAGWLAVGGVVLVGLAMSGRNKRKDES